MKSTNNFKLKSQAKNKVGEKVYAYESGKKKISFSMHPTKSFHYVIEKSENMSKGEVDKFLDAWIMKAMGTPKGMNQRIKEINF